MKASVTFLALLSFVLLPIAYPQGSLTPPAAPTPTMKSLTQVEPRTDVATLSGDSTNSYIINQPGSYYLTKNLNGVANTNGISIQADNVSLDLNGFALIGPGGTGTGIIVGNPQTAIAIRNGTIRNWGSGIYAVNATSSVISHIRAVNNSNPGLFGIIVGARSIVDECTAQGGGFIGIEVGVDSTVSNCTSQGNSSAGIYAGSGSVVSNCTADGNAFTGIDAENGTTVIGCTARETTVNGFVGGAVGGIGLRNNCHVVNCVASGNLTAGIFSTGVGNSIEGSVTADNGDSTHAVTGIQVGNTTKIVRCVVNGNASDGISISSAGAVTDCVVGSNGNGAITAGIHVTGYGNRIEANEVRDNNKNGAHGISVDNPNAHNVIIRNTAGNNGFNYDIAAGNGLGPIISADAGNVGNASNSPFANIQD